VIKSLAMGIIQNIRNKIKYNKLARISFVIDTVSKYAGGCFAPEYFKRQNILEYFTYYNCEVFVETGTYTGETTSYMVPHAKEIHTIELSEKLYKKAAERFKDEPKVHCYQGNSSDVLKNIVPKLDKKPLFYLDGHYSGSGTAKGDKNTPVTDELQVIANSKFKSPVILIDDARLFGFDADYPSLFKLKLFVKENFKNAEFEVYNDVIRIVVNETAP